MAIRRPISLALSSMALAGFAALAAGAATPASAQTVAGTSNDVVVPTQYCDWRLGNCQTWTPTWQQTWQQPVMVQPVYYRPWWNNGWRGGWNGGWHHHHGGWGWRR